MILKNYIKSCIKTRYPFLNDIYSQYLNFKYRAQGCIYMLHRVGNHDDRRLSPNENMKISPEFLEMIIKKYKSKGISFISLDDVVDYLKGDKKINGRFVCFTLDDGYKDNYTKAYPIFKKYNVPFTVFVATDFPDYKALLWWYELEDLLLKSTEIHLGNGEIILCKTMTEKCNAFMYIREKILQIGNENFLEDYKQLLCLSESNIYMYVKELSMTWEDISQMSKDPLCTIGGHSISHPAFNKLSEDEMINEVKGGCGRLEKHIGIKIEHFAYPFGTPNEIGEREHIEMKKFCFKSICTTDTGFINTNSDKNRLPRIFLGE